MSVERTWGWLRLILIGLGVCDIFIACLTLLLVALDVGGLTRHDALLQATQIPVGLLLIGMGMLSPWFHREVDRRRGLREQRRRSD